MVERLMLLAAALLTSTALATDLDLAPARERQHPAPAPRASGQPLGEVPVDEVRPAGAEGPGEPFSDHGHYINMTNESYTKVACGFYTTPGGAVWSVQNFSP